MRRICAAVLLFLVACDDEVVGFMSGSSGGSELPETTTGLVGESTDAGATTGTSTGDDASSSSGGSPASDFPRWVAYSLDSGLAVSYDDGETWMDVPDIEGMDVQEDLVRGEDYIVMVGGSDAARSVDGVVWEHADVELGYARAVAYGSGGYASVGIDHIAWSVDGVTWQDVRGRATGFDLVALAYAEGRFVGVGIEVLATSENGLDWTLTNIGGEKLRSVTFGEGRFVAVGEMGRILETQDGVTVLRDVAAELPGAGEIDFCRGQFVTGGPNQFWTSPDALAWTDVLLPVQGNFGCSDTAYIVPKDDGIYRSPMLADLQQVHVPSQPLFSVRSTEYP